jgi:hypothetical protein
VVLQQCKRYAVMETFNRKRFLWLTDFRGYYKHCLHNTLYWKIFFISQFILQAAVIHLAECYSEEVLQCLGEGPSAGPLCR